MNEGSASKTFVLHFSNRFDQPVGFNIEPWGDHCVMAPRDVVQLHISGPTDTVPEFVLDGEGITFVAAAGTTCRGWRNGKQVLHGETPFPGKGIDVLRRIGLFGANKRPPEDS